MIKRCVSINGGTAVRTTSKNLRIISLIGLVFLMVFALSGSVLAQGSVFGTVTNTDLSTPANGEISFYGFLDDTDEEIRIETSAGAGYDAGNWFDDFQNYLTEGPGNPYDYYFYNVVNGEGFHLENLIPNNSFQQENIQLGTTGWPGVPTGLSGGTLSSTAILLRWNAVPGLTYHVYRRVQPSTSSFFRLDNPSGTLADPGVADSFFVDLSSDGASSYDYLIIAEDALGNLSPHSTVVTISGAAATAPTLVSVDPNSGPSVGGNSVNVYGAGFDPAGIAVQFDASTPVPATVISPFHLMVVVPANVPSVVDVSVTNTASGLSSVPLVAAYTYEANTPPTLALIGPQSVDEGNLLTFGTSASDVEGGIPIMTSSALPGLAAYLDNGDGTGTFSWQTTFVDAGSYPVTFYATDFADAALIDSELVVITVNEAGNQTPSWTAVNDTSIAEGNLLQLTLSATDADLTVPVLSAINLPTGATFLDNTDGTGSFDFTPDFTQAGVYNVTFIADDGTAADSMTVVITVTNTNQAPLFVVAYDTTISENDTLVLVVTAFDPDGTIPALRAENLPATNAVFVDDLAGNGTLTFAPDFSQAGVYPISFIAADGTLEDTIIVTVTVTDLGNQPPVLTLVADTAVNEGDTLNLLITASDPDGTFATLSAIGLPANAGFVDNLNNTGLMTFIPDFTQSGVYPVQFVADDGLLADTITVTITVNEVGNLPPVFAALSDTSINENQQLQLTVSVTDPDALPGEFPALSINASLNNFTFTDNGDGTGLFTYLPDYFDAGVVTVTFFATDLGIPTMTAVASIQLTTVDVNQPPVFVSAGPFGITLGDTLVFTVFATDSTDAIFSNTLLLSVQNAPANSQFVDNGDNSGTFTFFPDSSQLQSWTVNFLAVDQGTPALSASIAIGIDVVTVNSAPIITGLEQGYIVDEGTTLVLAFSASDPDGGLPALYAENIPDNSSFTDNGDGTGSFSFSPDYMQGGGSNNSELYYVTFKAFDGFVYAKQVVLFQVVDAGDQTPVFDPLPTDSVVEGETVTVTISASDPDGFAVSLSAIDSTLPPNATFTDLGDGSAEIVFNPDYTQAGVYDVSIIVTDGTLSDTTVITITVIEAGNQSPVLDPIANQTIGELYNLNFTVTVTDLDGDFPIMTAAPLPGTATYTDNADGSALFDWTPSAGDSGTYAIWFYAEDAAVPGVFDSLEMFITVVDTNRAPRGLEYRFGPDVTLYEGDTLIWRVYGYDLDGTPPTIKATLDGQDTLATNMTFDPAFQVLGDTVYGELRFTPDYTQGAPNPGQSYFVRFFLIDAFDTLLITPVPIQPLNWVVWDKNQPPEFRFVPDSVGPWTVTEGDSLKFSVIGIDPDSIIRPLLNASNLPPNSFVAGTSDSLEFRFYPDFTQSGSYTTRWVVTDIGGAVDTQLIDIDVIDAGNQRPFFYTLLSDTTLVPVSTGISLYLRSSDPDQDLISMSVQPDLFGATFVDSGNGRGSYIYTPPQVDVGNYYDVMFITTDESSLTDTLLTTFSIVNFLRGDLDQNSKYTMNDLAFLISYLYRDGEQPAIAESADVNADGLVNLLDVTYLIRFLYISGPEPPGN